MVKEQRTPENAKEAMRMINEIVSVDRTSKTAIFKRLGITGESTVMIARELGCTDTMLERIRTEHARVCGAGVASKAAKSGMLVAPREVPAPVADEPEDDEDEPEPEDEDAEDEEQDDDAGDGDALTAAIDDEDEGDVRPRPAPRPARDVVTQVTASAARPPRPRFGPTVPGKGAPLLALERSELHRAADVIAALGGIDNAERVVSIVLALKGAA